MAVERMLLPLGCHFPNDAKEVIRCWESKEVVACPGSGKTTVLLAKLKLLADRMPLEHGAGICVLSHTNVAVNEIKAKMADYAGKLMGYPNYVGTIQSFVDKYVTMPYIKRTLGISVRAVDAKTYAEHLHRIICSGKYEVLKGKIISDYRNGSGQFANEIDYISALHIRDDGALCIGNRNTPLAGAGRTSSVQFRMALQDMIMQERIIKYTDAYRYAKCAIEELSADYADLFSRRFSFLFVDEYQDCKEDQREALGKLFDPQKCCVFYIGDPDQAIYGSDKDAINDWQPQGSFLTLGMSNRYGQPIADTIRPLRSGKKRIAAASGTSSHKPILFIYDMGTISSVKDQFIHELDAHGLIDERGIYKAIGHIRNSNSKGITIGSYWSGFIGSRATSNAFRYWGAIDEICERLKAGQMYLVEPLIRKLICRVFHYAGMRNAKTGKEHTSTTLKETLNDKYSNEYRDSLIAMAKLFDYNRETVSMAFHNLIDALFTKLPITGHDIMCNLPAYFMEEPIIDQVPQTEQNTYIDPIRGRRIQFDTVHGVKGETHDATLYLETEMSGSSDIIRILPWLGVGKEGTSRLFDYSRKMVYVGMSRPKFLLCLAIRESTYARSKSAFQDWELIDLRKNLPSAQSEDLSCDSRS